MKRFLVFVYDSHYPSGGWNDLELQTDSLEEAKTFAKLRGETLFADIIDTQTGDGEIVDWRTGEPGHGWRP